MLRIPSISVLTASFVALGTGCGGKQESKDTACVAAGGGCSAVSACARDVGILSSVDCDQPIWFAVCH